MEFLTAAAGRPTTLAVREAIRIAKAGEPLRPVRVIVSSNLAGLSLRRRLGSGELASRSDGGDGLAADGLAGIANVSFSTPFQFASLLAAPTLAALGLRPLTTSVLAAAVRHVLSTSPGRFGQVAEHVATESALIRAYGEITEMPPNRRQFLADSATERTREVLAFVAAVDEHLASGRTKYHDEYTVLRAAVDVATSPDKGPSELNDRLVVVGPFSQGLATIEFLRDVISAMNRRAGGTAPVAVWASTADPDVDASAGSQAESIFGPVSSQTRPSSVLPTPTALVPTADSDEEVREVVRSILASAERGARFDSMAIFVPMPAPYLRTVREQLELAGIPSAGPEYRTLADSMTGRLLRSLLDLVDSRGSVAEEKRFEREAVLALVNAAPVRGPDGRAQRVGPWENLSRSAGVVSGLDGWAGALNVHIESIEQRIVENPTASESFVNNLRREQATTISLREFVAWLGELTSADAVGRTWSERAAWLRSALASLLPAENRRGQWPDSEIDAAQRIDKILSRVAVLDEIEPTLTSSSFVRALQLELDVPAGRRGRFGTGVLVAPLASAIGLDLDEVYILGLAEGTCPRPIREDTLIPDVERERTEGGLRTRTDKNREERQRYLHAVASGSSAATLVMPQGDHRSGRERTVSRWWVEAMRNLAVARGVDVAGEGAINSRNWMESRILTAERRGSFDESLLLAMTRGIASSHADLQLQRSHLATTFDIELGEDERVGPLKRGLEMIDERLVGFNRFTGDLSGAGVISPAGDGRAVSPSLLEQWATCPRRYFLARVLGLGEIERPEEIVEISALDRGSLVHVILEDFIRESLDESSATTTISDPEQRWTEQDRRRLVEIAHMHFQEYEDLNRTGKAVLWEIRKEETLADLELFLRSDEDLRMNRRTIPRDVEMPFGMEHRYESSKDAAVVDLVGGRTLSLRGLIDRVDTRPQDGAPVVIDYKTSKAQGQKDFDTDPVRGGTKLQLGAYAYAAKQAFGSADAYAYYWYASSKGGFKTAGYRWSDDQDGRFVTAVTTILDGIEAGQFPPNPGEYNQFFGDHDNCRYCPFNRLCPGDRAEELEAAISSGRLVDYVAMKEPDLDADENAGGLS